MTPGIHFGVRESDYHAFRAVSKSLLWDFYQNPYHWKYGPKKEQTKAMAFGSLVDCLLLTPGEMALNFVMLPEDAPDRPQDRHVNAKKPSAETIERAEWWANFDAKANGLTVITADDRAAASEACEAIRSHSMVPPILLRATVQASICLKATEPETRLEQLIKGRLDIIPEANEEYGDWIFDLKTINSLSNIEKHIADFGYHGQAALYLDLYNQAATCSAKRHRFGFIFCESDPPYETAVVELDSADIAAGRDWYQRAFALWCRCERDQSWPSPWADQIITVSRPSWAKKGEQP